MTRAALLLAIATPLVSLTAGGCGAAKPTTEPHVLPVAATAAPSDPAARIVTVTATGVPADAVIDGSVAEWGDLTVLPPASEALQGEGPSHVAVALTKDALLVVGAIAGDAKGGFTLALHQDPGEFPEIGYVQRYGGVMPLGECPEKGAETFGMPADECKQVRAAYANAVAEESARFTSILRITQGGISSTRASVTSAIAKGKFASKRLDDGFTFEAELPLTALPRSLTAPMDSIGLAASVSEPSAFDAWIWAPIEPVSFEPGGALRAFALGGEMILSYVERPRLSYQPGDPNKIEVLSRDASGFGMEITERALHSNITTDGDLAIELVDLGAPYLVAVKGGHVTGSTPWHGRPEYVAKRKLGGRDGWLLVSPWTAPGTDLIDVAAVEYAGFDAALIFVDDGEISQNLVANEQIYWTTVTPAVSKDAELLTLAGRAFPGGMPTGTPALLTRTWKLDPAGGYVTQ